MLVNPQLTFDTLVVGPHNREAVSLALLAVERAGQGGWMLSIHSAARLGKTHLLHALGNRIVDAFSARPIAIGSAEYFANALSADENSLGEAPFWRAYFERAEVLLLDDVDLVSPSHPGVEVLWQTVRWFRMQGRPTVAMSRRPLLGKSEPARLFGASRPPRNQASIAVAPFSVCLEIAMQWTARLKFALSREQLERCAREANGNPADVIGRVLQAGREAA